MTVITAYALYNWFLNRGYWSGLLVDLEPADTRNWEIQEIKKNICMCVYRETPGSNCEYKIPPRVIRLLNSEIVQCVVVAIVMVA